jgi:hypothetical protein
MVEQARHHLYLALPLLTQVVVAVQQKVGAQAAQAVLVVAVMGLHLAA